MTLVVLYLSVDLLLLQLSMRFSTLKKSFFMHVHYFGQVTSLIESRRICDEHDMKLIEDCAHLIHPSVHAEHAICRLWKWRDAVLRCQARDLR